MTRALERPVFDALVGRQSGWAVGGLLARRFVPEIGPLAGARDDSPESLDALAELAPTSGPLLLLQADEIVLPPGTVATTTATGVQMIATRPVVDTHSPVASSSPAAASIVRLAEADWPAMLVLAAATKPGPFAARTPTLGDFWGIKIGGTLVAMAGERMKHAGYTELSGVCTHPDARRHGLGRLLSSWVAARIFERGDTPYLHAYASNSSALELYRSLGFAVHRTMHVAAIAKPGPAQ